MEKLEQILEYEFHLHQEQNFFHDKAMKKLHIKLEDVKDDEDVFEYVNQLKRDITYNAMRKVDEAWYEVKQANKKRKIVHDNNTCTQPLGLCRCSKELPIKLQKLVE